MPEALAESNEQSNELPPSLYRWMDVTTATETADFGEVASLRGVVGSVWRRHRRQSCRMREVISTPDAPKSPLYSQGIKTGGHIFVSGLVGIDVTTGHVAGPSIQHQTRQAILNCQAVLRAAGASLSDVVEVGVLLHDPEDFTGMNEEWSSWFPVEPPTRSVARLGAVLPGILISIRMTASHP